MRVLLVTICVVALSGCSPTISPVASNSDGYDAIEFLRAAQIRDHSINVYTFDAGSRFVADRYGENGQKVYCGLASINSDGRPFNVCVGFEEPATIVLGPGASLGREVKRPQSPNIVRHIKLAF